MWIDTHLIRTASHALCPKCEKSGIYCSKYSLTLKEKCDSCALPLAENDSADGPTVFITFILGFLIVPLALWVDHIFSWELWLHAVVWTTLMTALTVGMLRPMKAYIINLQYKYRPQDLEKK